jgi:hypothetical protein
MNQRNSSFKPQVKTVYRYLLTAALAAFSISLFAADGINQQFCIVAIPDTQSYYSSEDRMARFSTQMDWIVGNAPTRDEPAGRVPFKDIVFVTQLGDVIQDCKAAILI